MTLSEGFLHFDVTNGCTAAGLIAALQALPQRNADKTSTPLLAAQAHRTLALLESANVTLSSADTDQITCFFTLLNQLNPSYVTASPIALSRPSRSQLVLSEGIPTTEMDVAGTLSDPVGIALLKTIVCTFGPRPSSTIMAIGTGAQTTHALWCLSSSLPSLPTSQGPNPERHHDVQLQAELGADAQLVPLQETLVRLGATHTRIGHFVTPQQMMLPTLTTLVPTLAVQECLTAIYTLGNATHIVSSAVESYTLVNREVVVPVAQGQQEHHCRVTVWYLGTTPLRVQPHEADVRRIAKHMGFAAESVRQDVIDAYQRWA